MYNIKHIEQQDRSGCGIACIAMLSGKSYEEIRNIWIKKFGRDKWNLHAVGNGAGVTAFEMQEMLVEVGLPKVRLVSAPCIVNLGHHFVVVTPEGEILDPATNKG